MSKKNQNQKLRLIFHPFLHHIFRGRINQMDNCIFCKIIKKEIPKEYHYEDDFIIVINDINPMASTHLLFISKEHIKDFTEMNNDSVLLSVKKAIQEQIQKNELMGKGYKIVVNGGGAQFVDHLHFHLIGPIGSNAAV